MENKEIGYRIKERREEIGASVTELANVTGLSKATIHRYENGEIKTIKLPVIDRIAKYLDVGPLWMMCKTDKKRNYEVDCPQELTVVIDYLIRILRSGDVTINGESIDQYKRTSILSVIKAVRIMTMEK